jgi:putative SOS response-associated peptidase YedK
VPAITCLRTHFYVVLRELIPHLQTNRMPALLSEKQFAPWLSGEAGVGILKPAPNDYLQRWPVSKRVNSSKADVDDATLIERVELASVA